MFCDERKWELIWDNPAAASNSGDRSPPWYGENAEDQIGDVEFGGVGKRFCWSCC